MATFDSPLALYKHQLHRFERLQHDFKAGHRDIAEQGQADMIELTSGTPSGRARLQILRENRPFARRPAVKGSRHGRGAKGTLPNLPIGMISGRLRRSMQFAKVTAPGAIQAFAVGPEGVDYAKYILNDAGTRKMKGRGFQAEIKKRFRARNKALIDYARSRQRRP